MSETEYNLSLNKTIATHLADVKAELETTIDQTRKDINSYRDKMKRAEKKIINSTSELQKIDALLATMCGMPIFKQDMAEHLMGKLAEGS